MKFRWIPATDLTREGERRLAAVTLPTEGHVTFTHAVTGRHFVKCCGCRSASQTSVVVIEGIANGARITATRHPLDQPVCLRCHQPWELSP